MLRKATKFGSYSSRWPSPCSACAAYRGWLPLPTPGADSRLHCALILPVCAQAAVLPKVIQLTKLLSLSPCSACLAQGCPRRTATSTTPRTFCTIALSRAADKGLHAQAAVLPKVIQLTKPLKPLAIPVFCLYGTGVPTEDGYFYNTPHFSSHAPDAPASVSHGDGDGTVNIQSLEACQQCALLWFSMLLSAHWLLLHFSSHAFDAPASVLHGDGDGTVNIQSLEACQQCAPARDARLCPQTNPRSRFSSRAPSALESVHGDGDVGLGISPCWLAGSLLSSAALCSVQQKPPAVGCVSPQALQTAAARQVIRLCAALTGSFAAFLLPCAVQERHKCWRS